MDITTEKIQEQSITDRNNREEIGEPRMAYTVYAKCLNCGKLDYREAEHFTYCPDCGSKVKIMGECGYCGRIDTEEVIKKHHYCKCEKHNRVYKRYGGLFGDFECPLCRKERLNDELTIPGEK